ncbi:MAG: exopolysaccharide biosynthesis protein, partial [Sporomusaceae bacterium]|nr:exopolysaccharide biosynthesis protein [Sporomusaceae bacterium]
MDEEQSIDLQKLFQIASDNKKRLLGIIGFCVAIALLAALILPNKYTSSVLVRAKSPSSGLSGGAAAAMALLGGGAPGTANLQSYQEMIKSRRVLEPVIAKLDLPEEQKEKITNESFAKKYLDISNPKGSDLIQIKVEGRSPEEAQMIAQNILENLKTALTNMGQVEQSVQMKFLSERLGIAKKEMEDAEIALDQFRRATRVYAPDDQARSALGMVDRIDQQIIELEIQKQTNDVRLQTVNAQLEKQNIALRKYTVADSEPVQQIRRNLLDKQMALVDRTQRYTEKHPEVVLIRKEVAELEEQLRKEIEQSILAGTSTLNPIHASLLQAKSNIEAAILTSSSMEEVLRNQLTIIEERLNTLSTETRNYVSLERQVRITQEMYALLTRNYEQTRIQESLESMDIQ